MIYSLLSLLPFMACLFWTAILVVDRRHNNAAQPVFTIFMGTCTVLYLCHAIFFNCEPGALPLADNVYGFCTLAVFPLYSLYLERLTSGRPLGKGKFALFLLPAMVGCVLANGVLTRSLFFLQLLPVCWWGFHRLRHFDRKIENFFSDTELRSVKQTRHMMLVLVVCSFCSGVANFIGRDYFLLNPHLLFIPSLTFSILLFSVGFVGVRQRYCADELETVDTTDSDDPDDTSDKTAAFDTARLARLDEIMAAECLYLQPDLRLSDLAQRMDVGRSTLSALINKQKGVSFSDYINTLRIARAQEIMRSPEASQLSVIQICERSGFSNERSFYRAFVKAVGMTPRQWLKASCQPLS